MDEWNMITKHLWNDAGRTNPKYSEENPVQVPLCAARIQNTKGPTSSPFIQFKISETAAKFT